MREEVRVLVVEDDPDLREAVQLLLEFDHYHVRTASSAAAARVALAEFTPMCMILDLGLPDAQTGIDFARESKASHPDLVIVVMTGEADQDRLAAAEAAGVDYVMQKPVDSDLLRKILPPL